jgi:DNA repair photolyase
MDNIDDFIAAKAVRGRATGQLTKGRFESVEIAYAPGDEQQIKTQVFKDTSRTIISYNDSPDVGMNTTLNPYRGCEHGCIYCYARPTHEYLGLSAGLDFESKIFAKMDAPELLRKTLQAKSWEPKVIGMSGVTDCYQPIEKQLELTRKCLEVLAEYKNPVVIITKNHLVTRDLDILLELSRYDAVNVVISITTLDRELANKMEPRASQPLKRLQAVRELSAAGVPVSVNMAPLIPGLTDHEIPSLLKAAVDAGARSANYVMARLPYSVKDLFKAWLVENFPLREQKVLHRIEEVRGGKLNSSQFGDRMVGEGPYAEHIAQVFNHYRRLYGLTQRSKLSTEHFQRSLGPQLSLF